MNFLKNFVIAISFLAIFCTFVVLVAGIIMFVAKYFSMLGIAVLGFFAIAAVLAAVMTYDTDDGNPYQ